MCEDCSDTQYHGYHGFEYNHIAHSLAVTGTVLPSTSCNNGIILLFQIHLCLQTHWRLTLGGSRLSSGLGEAFRCRLPQMQHSARAAPCVHHFASTACQLFAQSTAGVSHDLTSQQPFYHFSLQTKWQHNWFWSFPIWYSNRNQLSKPVAPSPNLSENSHSSWDSFLRLNKHLDSTNNS